jgi:hypothetical protein
VRYAVGDNRVDLVRDDGARASAWWATKNEWLGLIDVAGLELEALYGGFAGEPFTEDSREYVFVTRAPGGLGLPGPSNGRDQSAWLTVPGCRSATPPTSRPLTAGSSMWGTRSSATRRARWSGTTGPTAAS